MDCNTLRDNGYGKEKEGVGIAWKKIRMPLLRVLHT